MSQKFFNTSHGLLLSFPRMRESRFFLSISWIPGRASYRQLARNDVGIVSTNLRDSTLALYWLREHVGSFFLRRWSVVCVPSDTESLHFR